MAVGPFSPASTNSSRAITQPENALVVRRAITEDRTPLSELIHRAYQEASGRRGGWVRMHRFGSSPEALLDQVLDPAGPIAFIAIDETELLGFALVDREPPRLELIYVRPTHRRRGIGSSLVEEAARDAGTWSDVPFTALVAAGDRAEKSLFESLGYRAELLIMGQRPKI